MKSPIAPPRITRILPCVDAMGRCSQRWTALVSLLIESSNRSNERPPLPRPKRGQSQDGHEQSEREPDGAADAHAFLIGGGPMQQIAHVPRPNREPDARDD